MLDSRGMDFPRSQFTLGPCRLTSAPRAQTNKTRFSPLQSHTRSSLLSLKSPSKQRALPLGTHTGATGSERTTISSARRSPNVIHVGKSPQPASPKAKIALVSPINSQQYNIEDIVLRGFNLCRTDSPNTEIHVFREVPQQDFEVLANLVERLSYNPTSRLLLVEMPTAAHEFAITDFSRAVQPVLDSLPINSRRLRVRLEHDLSIRSPFTGFLATPDLALVATSTGRSSWRNILAVVECAFSQDRPELMQKIQYEVEGWPEIQFVLAIFVTEIPDYKSPLEDSPTWKYFSQHTSILPSNLFLALPPSLNGTDDLNRHAAISSSSDSDSDDDSDESDDDRDEVVLSPVTIAGHTWCDVREVQYRVWVRQDGVLNVEEDGVTGFLFPLAQMEGVEEAINSGLSGVKKEIEELVAKSTRSRPALRRIEEAELTVNFDWRAIQSTVIMATEQTAVSRYDTWFTENFQPGPHPDDRSYRPSSSDNSPAASLDFPDSNSPRYTLRSRIQTGGN